MSLRHPVTLPPQHTICLTPSMLPSISQWERGKCREMQRGKGGGWGELSEQDRSTDRYGALRKIAVCSCVSELLQMRIEICIHTPKTQRHTDDRTQFHNIFDLYKSLFRFSPTSPPPKFCACTPHCTGQIATPRETGTCNSNFDSQIICCISFEQVFPPRTAYRVAKTHRIPYLYRSFSAKEPYI